MEALGLNLGYLLVQILNFLVVLIVLRAFVFSPIVNLLNRRRAAISQGLEDARIASEARANAEKDAQEIISKAQTEANYKMREATERAEITRKEILAQAEKEVSEAREAALAEVRVERDHLLADIRGQVAALAMAATQKLIGEALDEKRQHSLIDEFFSGIQSGKVVLLEDTTLSGASTEVTSALPLTDNEKELVRQEVLSKIGSQTITFRVDPEILGGIVVKVGDKILDGSVYGQLESLRQQLG